MEINHPKHYNQYPVEVIDMMVSIWGKEATRTFCLLNAFKYRMRIGHKDDIQADLAKEKWYLDKAKELSTSFHERINIALGADRVEELMKNANRDINSDELSQSGVLQNFKPSTVPGDIQTISNNETGF